MIGKVLGDRYEIIEKIGGGGMALVYKAKCRLLNRYVAIKILRPEFTEDEEFVKKFKRESQAAASLSHPNIVGIYDVGIEDKTYYIVMEYVKGQTLKELIKEKGALNPEFATNLAIQISSAIDHAHKNHIVHRDIKSHNILIKDDNTVKVTDFGIARAVTSTTITNTGNVIGSVHYFSPEQARGGYTDEKSDIYSLGVVIYEMITGRLPFEGETPIAVALKHVQEEPVRPSEINPRLPKAIEEITLKCMQKEISRRYNSAEEIISDLRQSLVMPNGDFVKRNKFTDESTRVVPVIRVTEPEERDEKPEEEKPEKPEKKQKPKKKEEDKGNNKGRKLTAIAILGGLILALVIGGGALALKNLFSVKEVPVPDLTNLSESQARDKLNELGLFMEVTERVHNKDIPDGQVIRQDPKPGEGCKVTNPVKVVVSKGPNKVPVPNLIGENFDNVDLLLEKNGLVEGQMKQEFSQTYPAGIVISQSIAAGVNVDEGTAIDYVISQGSEKVPMPNYIGLNIEDVKKDLIVKDLVQGNISYENSNDYANGTVISQNIKAGTEVTRKSSIDFVVSKGPADNSNVSLKLRVELPQNLDQMKVTVYKVQNDVSRNIYEKVHNASDSPLFIPISGEGEVLFEVYINDSLYKSIKYKFQ